MSIHKGEVSLSIQFFLYYPGLFCFTTSRIHILVFKTYVCTNDLLGSHNILFMSALTQDAMPPNNNS